MWISNYVHYKVWNETTSPFPNFNGATVEVWERISNIIFTERVIILLGVWLFILTEIKVNSYWLKGPCCKRIKHVVGRSGIMSYCTLPENIDNTYQMWFDRSGIKSFSTSSEYWWYISDMVFPVLNFHIILSSGAQWIDYHCGYCSLFDMLASSE